jgi:hypothetical protein
LTSLLIPISIQFNSFFTSTYLVHVANKNMNQPHGESGKLSLVMTSGVAMQFKSCTFVLDEIASSVVDAAVSSGYVQVGAVTLLYNGRKEECVTKIYSKVDDSIDSTAVCLIYKCGNVPDTMQSKWAQLLLSYTDCKSCLVLSGLPTAAYNSDMALGGLRVLFSSVVKEDIMSLFDNCTPLEVGNVISGSAAAIICQCEYSSIEAVACVSLRGSSYTYEAAKMFEQITDQVSKYLGVEQLSLSGNNVLHNKMVKADLFLSRTENMYI